jgi:prepilin-type processing-associated H-X9-DG protein
MQPILKCLFTMLLLFSSKAMAAEADAPANAAGLAAAAPVVPFIDSQTVLVARLDATAVDVGAFEAWVRQATLPGAAKSDAFFKELHEGFGKLSTAQGDFRKAGGRLLYAVVSFGDTPGGLAFIVAPVENRADPQALEKVLSSWSSDPATHAVTVGKAVVLPFGDALARLEHFTPAPRPELAKAFAEAGDVPLSVAFIPSEQVRRVVEAISPRLPKDIGGGPITVLTRGLMSGSVALRLPPQPALHAVIHSQDADAANAFAGLVRLALLAGRDQFPPEMTNLVAALVRPPSPKMEGDRVIFTVDEKTLVSLVRRLPGGPRPGAVAAYRVKSASNIRQLLLACIMDAHDHKDQFAESLEAAVGRQDVEANVLINPSNPSRKPGYVYVRPTSYQEYSRHASTRVMVYEAFDRWDDGINVGFGDGHVEFIHDQAQFLKMLTDSGGKLDKK